MALAELNFDELFENHYLSLCFFANKYLKDMDLSRSLVQDVFVDIWEKHQALHVETSIKNYLFRAVRNRCLDLLRKHKNMQLVPENEANQTAIPFKDLVQEAELSKQINDAIDSLPDRCREIFLLSRIEELKYVEIANRLNISVKTVEMQVGIALKKLRSKLSVKQLVELFYFFCIKKMQTDYRVKPYYFVLLSNTLS